MKMIKTTALSLLLCSTAASAATFTPTALRSDSDTFMPSALNNASQRALVSHSVSSSDASAKGNLEIERTFTLKSENLVSGTQDWQRGITTPELKGSSTATRS